MKWVITLALLVVGFSCFLMTGCTASELIKNNVDICTLLDCGSLGIVDIAGQRNTLVPNGPDYDKDPTCTLPGMCGPSIYYPNSSGSTEDSDTTQ